MLADQDRVFTNLYSDGLAKLDVFDCTDANCH